MSKIIKKLINKSYETYSYSDCDGGNNYGVQLDEIEFAKNIIKECIKLNNQFVGEDLVEVYKKHFGIKLD